MTKIGSNWSKLSKMMLVVSGHALSSVWIVEFNLVICGFIIDNYLRLLLGFSSFNSVEAFEVVFVNCKWITR